MEYIVDFRKLVDEFVTCQVVDATCVRFGYTRDADFKHDYEGLSPEDLIAQSRHSMDEYQFNNWAGLKREIGEKIRELKDDELELGRFIREQVLQPLYNQLWLYYGVAPLRDPTTFQIIVAALFYRDPMDMPDALVELHRKHVTEEVEIDKTIPPEEKANEIQRRCNKTESVFEHRYRDPLFTECRYFHVCFRRLASIIEGNLLLNNCTKDLFAYQKETDIVLYPSLRADEIAYEMNLTEAEVKKLAGGYTRLDYYTEFAGYGKNFDSVIILGVDISGFPELDSLLLQSEKCRVCDYPDHHFQRNLERFKKRCKEVMEEDIPQEKKELKVLGMVHILCRCYYIFKTDPIRKQYLKYAVTFFNVLDLAMLKATTPMCIKRYCLDLEYGKLLTDDFPDENSTTTRAKKGRKRKESWVEYGREVHLSHTLAFYKSRVCSLCDRGGCPFRKKDCPVQDSPSETTRSKRGRKRDVISPYQELVSAEIDKKIDKEGNLRVSCADFIRYCESHRYFSPYGRKDFDRIDSVLKDKNGIPISSHQLAQSYCDINRTRKGHGTPEKKQ